MSAKKPNCWEYMKCGRQPGGKKETALGSCPCSTDTSFDGINRGKNAGRICWAVAGTCRDGEVYGTYAQKRDSCVGCEFYKLVQKEEGTSEDAKKLLRLFSYNRDSPILKQLTIKVAKAGTRFLSQGDVQAEAYIIQRGSCLVISEKEGDLFPIDHRGVGDIVGISSLLTGEPQLAHFEAETDMELWVIDKKLFENISKEKQELLDFLTELVASRFDTRRPLADRVIGKYVATDIVARGSHSIVYRGINKGLNMPVAIKMLRHDQALIPDFLESFKNEAKIVASLNHENIVKVYDVEENYKTIFIIMEYIHGQTLDQMLRKKQRLPPSNVLDILIQICNGLVCAHEHGIVHQDIRPGNILVQLNGQIKIVDFGLACRPGDVDNLYWPGGVFYASPEYIKGDPVDSRSDIYSLGITAYEMITGQRPFLENTPTKALQFHLNGEFPDPRNIVPDLPEEFRNFIIKACRRNPDERYNSLYPAVRDLNLLAKELDLKTMALSADNKEVGTVFLDDNDSSVSSTGGQDFTNNFLSKERRLRATLLITDIVDSTKMAIELGDSLWGSLVEQHHRLVRREIAKFQGNEIETTGDGFIVTFHDSYDAIRCASSVRDAVHSIGIKIRAGLHFGESEVVDGVLHGLAVHVSVRVTRMAEPDEILATSAVKDAVSEKGIRFTSRGGYALKGIPGNWNLFAVDSVKSQYNE